MILVTEQRKLYFMLDSEDFCGTKLWMKAILSPATNTLMTPSKLESLEGSAFLCCHFCVILWNTALFVREREDNKWKLPLFKKEVRSKFFNPGIVSRGKKKNKNQETGFVPYFLGHIHMPIRFSRVHMFLAWSYCYPAFQPSLFVLGPFSSSSVQFHDSKALFSHPFSSRGSNTMLYCLSPGGSAACISGTNGQNQT